MKTQVAIIGGGPTGLLLSQLLHKRGIDSIVLKRKAKEYILGHIRAGVLERGFGSLMREVGVAKRLDAEEFMHDSTQVSFDDTMFRIAFKEFTGHAFTVYGQTEVTREPYAVRETANGRIEFNVGNVVIKAQKPMAENYVGLPY